MNVMRWDNGDGMPIFRYYLSWHIMVSISPIEDLYHPIIHDVPYIHICVCHYTLHHSAIYLMFFFFG